MRGELNAPCLINRNMAHHYWVHRGELKPICRLIHTNALGAPYGHCQPTGHGHGAKGGGGYGTVTEIQGSANSKQSFKDGNENNSQ